MPARLVWTRAPLRSLSAVFDVDGGIVRGLARALIGLLLIPVVHVPRLVYWLLQLSHAAVFANRQTLTASPAEHLTRARRILRRGKLSELLYAALEVRFAVERITHRELEFAEMASTRMLKEYDPVKQVANLRRLAPSSAFPHAFYFVNPQTGVRVRLGEYRPLDKSRVSAIQGRLGDLLHPKEGLLLGVPGDRWYADTRRFLAETVCYLSSTLKDNSPFFSSHGIENFEVVRVE